MDPISDHSRLVPLPADLSGPALARRAVRTTLGPRGVEAETIHRAMLVARELVTNAIVHTPSEAVSLAIGLRPEAVRLEVRDRSPDPPLLRHPEPTSTGGRGLLVVDALARDWGVSRLTGGGKGVWAEIAWPGPGGGTR